MAKRKRRSKVQSRAKLRRANSAKRGKARKAKTANRTVAKGAATRASVKKVVRKVKKPIAPVVETVAVEKPALADATSVTESLDPAA
jgi:hypothetical protein